MPLPLTNPPPKFISGMDSRKFSRKFVRDRGQVAREFQPRVAPLTNHRRIRVRVGRFQRLAPFLSSPLAATLFHAYGLIDPATAPCAARDS